MKKTTLVILAMLCTIMLAAQKPDVVWHKLFGGSSAESAYDIALTDDGGYIVLGQTESSDGDISNNHGSIDIWLIKLDTNAEILWERTFGGSDWELANSIKPTSDGGYVIVGNSSSDDDLTGHHGFRDGWVLKLDAEGLVQWEKLLGGSGADDTNDIIENKDGYLVAGYALSNDGDMQGLGCDGDFWMIQLDFNGNIAWSQCYGGSGIDVPACMVKAGDNYIIAGRSDSEDGDVTGNHGYDDIWVIEIDPAGTLLWEKSLGGSSTEAVNDIYYNPNTNEIVLVGMSHSEDGDVSTNYGDIDFWMVTLDANRDILYEVSFGGSKAEEAYDILPIGNDQYLIAGETASDDGDVTGFIGGADGWVLKTDLAGNIEWNKTLGGSGGDVIHKVIPSHENDGFITAGWTRSSDLPGKNFSDDVWLAKLGMTSSNNEILKPEVRPLIYPNPGLRNAMFQIKGSFDNFDHMVIRNNHGQIVHRQDGTDIFQLNNLAAGLYHVEFYTDNRRFIERLIIVE